MSGEQKSIPIPSWLTSSWPVLLTVFSMVAGYATLKSTVDQNSKQIEQLQQDLQQSNKDRLEAMEGVRNSLGTVQLNVARICEKLRVNCRD